MKKDMKLMIQLNVEGYATDIFRDLSKPEFKIQYESFIESRSPLFEDEPDWVSGSIKIESLSDLTKTLEALSKPDNLVSRRRKLSLYIYGEDATHGVNFSLWLGNDPHSKSGGEVRIDESILKNGVRNAAICAEKILRDALALSRSEE